MYFRKNLITALLVGGGMAAISGQASAHSYYNLTGAGTVASGDAAVGFGIANSINGTDGVSVNSNGTNRISDGTTVYNATTNNYISGTGSAASSAEVSGNLPYMWYSGQHTTATGYTKRELYTGSAVTDTTGNLFGQSLSTLTGVHATTPGGIVLPGSASEWGANNLASEWNAYNTKNTGTNAATWGTIMNDLPGAPTNDHPYLAVAGNSSSTGVGLDYGLIHVSCGTNTAADNCSSAGDILTTITLKNDSDYAANNGLLDVALYKGVDNSAASNRSAAADITGAAPSNIQGSDLGSAIWNGHMTSVGDILSYSFTFTAAEWAATEHGWYTLVIGGHGGSASNGYVYDAMVTTSPVPVPAAIWLLGSAMAGLVSFGRRKATTAVYA
jgi:hypothetical protein